ncbi:MAG TPA: hypothetical protein PKU94_06230 [Candidatus Hydrothermia bacterium]|nr:hypothetical protein [Candidatus Hydrothermia bacterium]
MSSCNELLESIFNLKKTEFISQTRVAVTGTDPVSVTIPTGTNLVGIKCASGAVTMGINAAATDNSYPLEEGEAIDLAIDNLTSLSFKGSGIVNLLFFK